jgi:hypothetical protein
MNAKKYSTAPDQRPVPSPEFPLPISASPDERYAAGLYDANTASIGRMVRDERVEDVGRNGEFVVHAVNNFGPAMAALLKAHQWMRHYANFHEVDEGGPLMRDVKEIAAVIEAGLVPPSRDQEWVINTALRASLGLHAETEVIPS